MAVERTLSIIKPDAVAKNVIGQIYARFEKAGLKIVAARMAWLSRAEAEGFYAVHRTRPFFKDLVGFMTSGPVMIQVLEGDGRDREEPRPDGRHRPEEGRAGHDPRGFRAIDRRERGARLRRAGDRRRRDRLLLPGLAQSTSRRTRREPPRPRPAGAGTLARRARREAVSRAPGVELGAPALRRRRRVDDRPRQVAARARSSPTPRRSARPR